METPFFDSKLGFLPLIPLSKPTPNPSEPAEANVGRHGFVNRKPEFSDSLLVLLCHKICEVAQVNGSDSSMTGNKLSAAKVSQAL